MNASALVLAKNASKVPTAAIPNGRPTTGILEKPFMIFIDDVMRLCPCWIVSAISCLFAACFSSFSRSRFSLFSSASNASTSSCFDPTLFANPFSLKASSSSSSFSSLLFRLSNSANCLSFWSNAMFVASFRIFPYSEIKEPRPLKTSCIFSESVPPNISSSDFSNNCPNVFCLPRS